MTHAGIVSSDCQLFTREVSMSGTKATRRKYINAESWQRYCGFLDLSIDEFMEIQNRLLVEQIENLKKCELGKYIFNGADPYTVEEFRSTVPLTTYNDYCPALLDRQEDILPEKPKLWIQTSGRSGEYPHKWVPMTEKYWNEAGLNFSALALLGACDEKGVIPYEDGLTLLNAASLRPYLTGHGAYKLKEELGFDFLPPLGEAEEMGFEERIEAGFKMALTEGIDGFYGLASVLVAIGEKFSNGNGNSSLSRLISQPRMLSRLAKGKLKSKIAGRKMLPKDLWSLKVIASMGTDCSVYKHKIKELWGRTPLEVYGNSETAVIATQTWDYGSMTFFPNLNFLEFIPESEHFKWKNDRSYQPKTLLLNEVLPGQNYELVITNFHGGALVRYRLGDMVRITSMRNEYLGIDIPQMVFERRADDLIDLGYMRLTERVIWQAIEHTGIPYKDWTAVKETRDNPTLHLYIELAEGYQIDEKELATRVYREIERVDDGLYVYNDLHSLEKLIGFTPVVVTALPPGIFSKYKNKKKSEGAALVHLKPPHINPSYSVLASLGVGVNSEDTDKVTINA